MREEKKFNPLEKLPTENFKEETPPPEEQFQKEFSREYQESIKYLDNFLDDNHSTMKGFFYTGEIKEANKVKPLHAYNSRTAGIIGDWFGSNLSTAVNKLKETVEFKKAFEKYPNIERLASHIIKYGKEIKDGLDKINHKADNSSNLIKEEVEQNSKGKFEEITSAYEAIKHFMEIVVNPSNKKEKKVD